MSEVHKEHEHQDVEITINGKKHQARRGEHSIEELRRLGDVPAAEMLCELKDGKYTDFDNKAHVEIHGREVFASHYKEHRLPEITINGTPYHTHAGKNSVEHLRHIGHVPTDEILSEFKHGKFVDLDNGAHVEIHGGEVFASHTPSGGSS